MNAPFTPTSATTLDWHDLLAEARRTFEHSPYVAVLAIERLRQEAEALTCCTRSCDWKVNKAIVDACEGFVDCVCVDCLDEIEALLADESHAPDEDRFWRDSPAAMARGMDDASSWGMGA